jgi:hypothetical protein
MGAITGALFIFGAKYFEISFAEFLGSVRKFCLLECCIKHSTQQTAAGALHDDRSYQRT